MGTQEIKERTGFNQNIEMLSTRNLTLLKKPISCLSALDLDQQKCGLKIRKSEPPPKMNIPAKAKLPILPKIPTEFTNFAGKVPKGTREMYRIMGEEQIHTDLIMGQFGIVAVHGGMIKSATFDTIRLYTGRKLKKGNSFAFYRVDAPYKPVTTHGIGKKLGGGKGSVKHYATPVRAGRVIMEVYGNVYWEEVQPWLNNVCKMLPFEAIAVNKDLLERLNKEEKRLQEENENPYTFEWMVRNNMFDCQRFLSPYDQKWFGRFVYKDRQNNKKWNLVRQSAYKSLEGKSGN